MGGLGEGCKEPYSQQVGCIIKLAYIYMFLGTSLILRDHGINHGCEPATEALIGSGTLEYLSGIPCI